ncbi:radical SAM protein [Verrucomicrobiota bacterium]
MLAILRQVIRDSSDIFIQTNHPPRNLTWFVTEKCNLRCKHCFVTNENRSPRKEMSFDDCITFLQRSELENVTLTGGEPLLYQDFPALFVQLSNKKGVKSVGVATNGFRHDVMLELLGKRNRSVYYRLQTSLDGPEAVHNVVRGSSDAFKVVAELLEGWRKINGIATHAIMTLSKFNLPYLEETIKIANDLGTYLSINFVRSSSDARAGNINDFIPVCANDLSVNEAKSAINVWRKTRQSHLSLTTRWLEITRLESIVYFMETGLWHFPCAAGINDAVLYSDGSVSVCETLLPLGNLYDCNLSWKALWKKNPQQYKTCYCMWDCAMHNSLSKSVSGYRTLAGSILGTPLH